MVDGGSGHFPAVTCVTDPGCAHDMHILCSMMHCMLHHHFASHDVCAFLIPRRIARRIASHRSTETIGEAPIAMQCCDLVSGDCRRHTASAAATAAEMEVACIGGWGYEASNATGLEAGLVPSSGGIHRASFSRAEWECEQRGLRLCKQSCAGQGCGYDELPVWTGLPCPTATAA